MNKGKLSIFFGVCCCCYVVKDVSKELLIIYEGDVHIILVIKNVSD